MKTIFAIVAAAGTVANASVLLNEFQPNQPGSDPSTQDVELMGTAGDSFNGFLYEIETDNTSSIFSVDRIEAISGTFGANGLLVGNIADLENPSATYILASGGTAVLGDLFDAGTAATMFGTIYDAVNSPDSSGDVANGVAGLVGGTDLGWIDPGNEPILIQRDSITGEWLQFNFQGDVFDAAGNLIGDASILPAGFDFNVGTFGDTNITLVPAPAAFALLGLGGLAATRRRR